VSVGPSPVLPAVVWDMGGIMYRYFTEILLERAAVEGWDLAALPLGPTGRLPDPDYEAMDAGRIDESDYLGVVRRRLATAGIDLDPVTAIDWSTQYRPAAWRVIDAVRDAGHPQALLTNDATKWLGERWWDTWPGTGRFDVIIDVAELGVRKPAPEPYLAAAEAMGLAPGDCIFVDDLTVNCDGAEAVGMGSQRLDIRDPIASLDRLTSRIGVDVDLHQVGERFSMR
jgi:putative hydrolase of the HAD superfamily